ncbi:hypothetical protein ACOME3_000884 [Neoechinorhynchus agilis]
MCEIFQSKKRRTAIQTFYLCFNLNFLWLFLGSLMLIVGNRLILEKFYRSLFFATEIHLYQSNHSVSDGKNNVGNESSVEEIEKTNSKETGASEFIRMPQMLNAPKTDKGTTTPKTTKAHQRHPLLNQCSEHVYPNFKGDEPFELHPSVEDNVAQLTFEESFEQFIPPVNKEDPSKTSLQFEDFLNFDLPLLPKAHNVISEMELFGTTPKMLGRPNSRRPVKRIPGKSSTKRTNINKSTFPEKNEPTENLHPSWTAAKKKNPVIRLKDLKPKKIMFDSD